MLTYSDDEERLALDLMNTDPHGPYRGCVRKGLRISDINAEVREYMIAPYLAQARALESR